MRASHSHNHLEPSASVNCCWSALAKSTGDHRIKDIEIDELLMGPDVALLAASLQRTLDAGPTG